MNPKVEELGRKADKLRKGGRTYGQIAMGVESFLLHCCGLNGPRLDFEPGHTIRRIPTKLSAVIRHA